MWSYAPLHRSPCDLMASSHGAPPPGKGTGVELIQTSSLVRQQGRLYASTTLEFSPATRELTQNTADTDRPDADVWGKRKEEEKEEEVKE
ncbi:hypothetical protein Pmani_015941 [Petrolisthes manimaculis]|uniref:Uncharacterized protein n=1 Tax=Petrolisthes manimaculis TaxID=1843537 RepID=A0AAE1PSV7_9EUCA|nr:hypothetical protein Pmani_015941 [Petrolisthes manimaculis]